MYFQQLTQDILYLMSYAAVATTAAEAPVTLLGAEAADKSDPGFWDQFAALGGHWEEADDGI